LTTTIGGGAAASCGGGGEAKSGADRRRANISPPAVLGTLSRFGRDIREFPKAIYTLDNN